MKQQIENFLLENGFQKVNETEYVQVVNRQGRIVVINGVRQQTQNEVTEFKFTYIGEGYEGNSETDNNKLTQWKLSVDDNESPEFLVHDLNEFMQVFTSEK